MAQYLPGLLLPVLSQSQSWCHYLHCSVSSEAAPSASQNWGIQKHKLFSSSQAEHLACADVASSHWAAPCTALVAAHKWLMKSISIKINKQEEKKSWYIADTLGKSSSKTPCQSKVTVPKQKPNPLCSGSGWERESTLDSKAGTWSRKAA